MKALKAFMKPFEGPQSSVKIKIEVNFYINTTFWNARGGMGKYFKWNLKSILSSIRSNSLNMRNEIWWQSLTQLTFTCWKSIKETLEEGVKYVQS